MMTNVLALLGTLEEPLIVLAAISLILGLANMLFDQLNRVGDR